MVYSSNWPHLSAKLIIHKEMGQYMFVLLSNNNYASNTPKVTLKSKHKKVPSNLIWQQGIKVIEIFQIKRMGIITSKITEIID